MKKSLLKLSCIVLSTMFFAACNVNEPENGSSSTGGDSEEENSDKSDYVEQHNWNDTVYIEWDGSSAVVQNGVDSVSVTNENGYVSISSQKKHVAYVVSGTGVGQLRFDSVSPKFQLIVDNLNLTCNDGPALNNQCHKTLYLVLNGTASLTDQKGYNTTSSNNEDLKAALFSEGQVIVSGNGELTVNGNNKHALASDDYIRIRSGNMFINATVNDGIHTNDGVMIENGTLVINAVDEGINVDEGSFTMTGGSVTVITSGTSAKGIKSYTAMTIDGGTINVKAPGTESEGIESKAELTINGGTVNVTSYDDAINAGSHLYIKGGSVTAVSTNNDGIDANGNLYVQGGTIIACGSSSPECGLDANEEGGYSVYFTGGTLLAIGGGNSTPSSSESTQAFISTSISVSAGQEISLTDGTTMLASFTVPESYSPAQSGFGGGGRWSVTGGPGGGGPGGSGGGVLITCAGLISGSTYTLNYGSSSASATAQLNGSSRGGGGRGW